MNPRPASFLALVGLALFSACSGGGSSSSPGTQDQETSIQVVAVDEDGAAPEGAFVLVNGRQAGTVQPDGTASVTGPVGDDVLVEVLVPHLKGGSGRLSTSIAGPNEVSILVEGKGCARDAALSRPDGAAVVDASGAEFRLRFTDPAGRALDLAEVDFVLGLDLAAEEGDLTSLFDLGEGDLVLNDPAALAALLGSEPRESRLLMSGVDSQGFDVEEALGLRVADGRLSGTLAPPPSLGTLDVSGLSLNVRLLDFSPSGQAYDFETASDADGGFEFPALPKGSYAFECRTAFAGIEYSATGTVFVSSAPVVLVVTPCAVQDLLDGVVPISVVSSLQANSTPADPRRIRSTTASFGGAVFALAAGTSDSASVTVSSQQQNVPVTDLATIVMPAGTSEVTLRFQVCTEEYPEFVIPQSEFNDNWQIQVFDEIGHELFNLSRNVNSQLFVDPIWQPDGCTGTLVEVLSLGATLAVDTDVSVRVSATNIGDSALTTTVTAEIGVQPEFDISKVTVDSGTDLYSQPRSGDSNLNQRSFGVEYTKPESAFLEHIRVDLCRASDHALLTTVLDEDLPSPSGAVSSLDDDSFRVRVTYGGGLVSTLASDPPPSRDVTFRVFLTARIDGTDVVKDRFSTQRRALWRMPTSIARYGARDAGLDDWCSLGAYEWLSAHGGLVTRVDDISGEHGRNIGHATHDRGTDIDMFHFTSLNPGSGTANYEALRKKVKEAAGGDDEALAVVTDWFASERAGLALLLARADVERMFGGLGDATQGVSAGWYRDLLRSGRTPASGTATIETGLGAWTATGTSKLAHNHVHNNHYHIDLRESAIGD